MGYLPYSTVLCHTLRMSCAQSKANILGVRVPHQHIVLIKLVKATGRRPSCTSLGRAWRTRTSQGFTQWLPGRPLSMSRQPSRRYVLRTHTVPRTYALVAGTTIARETIIACDHRVRSGVRPHVLGTHTQDAYVPKIVRPDCLGGIIRPNYSVGVLGRDRRGRLLAHRRACV